MHFEFATAARIVFGWGEARQLAAAAAQMGRRALVVTGSSPERVRPLIANLESAGVACALFSTPSEPTIDLIRAGAEYARAERLRHGDRDRRRQRHRYRQGAGGAAD
jgi:alcohol dehydrogenase class IV